MGRMHAREALVPGRMGMDAWMGVSASRRSRGLGASGGGGGLGASVMAVPDAVGQRAAEVERGRGRRCVSGPRLHDLHPLGRPAVAAEVEVADAVAAGPRHAERVRAAPLQRPAPAPGSRSGSGDDERPRQHLVAVGVPERDADGVRRPRRQRAAGRLHPERVRGRARGARPTPGPARRRDGRGGRERD